jgi:V/A-type H+-transporting ATPase subunit E
MAETIESFVQKLQQDGVEAGREQAERIRSEARKEADRILDDARDQADRIREDAEREADDRRSKTQTELALAARDTVHRLRQVLNEAMRAVVAHGAGEKLDDVEFLGEVLHELIIMYAQSDIDRKHGIEINLPDKTRQKLVQWALNEIGQEALDAMHIGIDLKGKLKTAGFEYTVSGGTVEVTRESVVETLANMVSPELQRILAEAVGGEFQAKLAAEQKRKEELEDQAEQREEEIREQAEKEKEAEDKEQPEAQKPEDEGEQEEKGDEKAKAEKDSGEAETSGDEEGRQD